MRDHSRVALLTALILLVQPAIPAQFGSDAYRGDNSDWWSLLRDTSEDSQEPAYQPGKAEPSSTNFQILGLRLAYNELFQRVFAKLGKSVEVDRGDASTGRAQLCYKDAHDRAYLIFETGEVELSFYIFTGGPAWNGSDRCAISDLVIPDLRTASGLRLGLTEAQIEVILGPPRLALNDRLIYDDVLHKRNSAAALAKLRKQNQDMGDKEFHENFDSYTLSTYIEVKFSNSKATYVAVSKSEVY